MEIDNKLRSMGFEVYFLYDNKKLKILNPSGRMIYYFPIDEDVIHLLDEGEYYYNKNNKSLILTYPFRKQPKKYEFIKELYSDYYYKALEEHLKEFSYTELYDGMPNNYLRKTMSIKVCWMKNPLPFTMRDRDTILDILSKLR